MTKDNLYSQMSEDTYIAEYSNDKSIVSVQFKPGIEEIRTYQFANCSSLKNVEFPTSVRVIGDRSFKNTKIEKLVIPEGVEVIEAHAFSECTSLEEVTLPSTLKKIGCYAFYQSGIKKLVLPEGIEVLETNAFSGCPSLEEITLPTTLKKTGTYAFSVSGIKKLMIPEGVEEIEEGAFLSCTSLEEVTLPSTLKRIGARAFYRSQIKKIVIPKGVEVLETHAFSECSSLEEIILPTTLKKIGELAFFHSKIKKIVIPEGVEEIESQAFSECSSLEEEALPSTLKKIGERAFYQSGIKRIVIPEGVEEIESQAFSECSSLEEVTLPSTIKKIGKRVFYQSGIKRIVIPEGVEEIESQAFSKCFSLEEVTLPSTLKKIGDQAFYLSGIKKIVIPEGVEEVESLAIWCSKLEEVTLLATIKKIEKSAFRVGIKKLNIASPLEYNNFWNACNFVNYSLSSIFCINRLELPILSFILSYKDYAFLKEINTFNYSNKNMNRNLKSLIFNIKTNFPNLSVYLIGPDLSFYQKHVLKKFFSKAGIESYTFLPEDKCAIDSLDLVDQPFFNNDDEEILLRMQKIDDLIAKYPEKTKSFIIKKREEFIKEYQEGMKEEKPILDFSKDISTTFGKKAIGFSKNQFLAKLDGFIQILSNQTKFSSKLRDYYKILESPARKMIEKPMTNEEILNNLVSLLPLLEENKKEEVIQEIKTNLEEMRIFYEQGIEERINLHHDFESVLYMKLDSLYNNTLSYYAYYEQAKPYISLKQSFVSNSNKPVGGVELLLFNFLEDLDNIKQQDYAKALYTSFGEIKNKYIKIIDYILENEEFENDNYQKIVSQLIKDMEPLLIYLYIIILQEKKQDNLQIEIQEELNRLQNQEAEISIQGTLQSFINDIEKFIRKKQLNDKDKETAKSEIERVLNSFLEKLKSSEAQGQIQEIEFELYKEMEGILLTIMTYEKDKKRYNAFYLMNKNMAKIRNILIKKLHIN